VPEVWAGRCQSGASPSPQVLQGHLIEAAFFDEQDRPAPRTGGYARIRRTYDARDMLIEEPLFNPQGNPVWGDNGYVKATFAYD